MPPALEVVLDTAAEWVGVVVQRCADGILVCYPEPSVFVPGVGRVRVQELPYRDLVRAAPAALPYDAALSLVAGSGKKLLLHLRLPEPGDATTGSAVAGGGLADAHPVVLDRLLEATDAVVAVRAALRRFGLGRLVVLTDAGQVRLLCRWAERWRSRLLVGVAPAAATVRAARGRSWLRRGRGSSGGTVLVATPRGLTRGAVRAARRAGMPLVVWMVDLPFARPVPRRLARWLLPGEAWLVVTGPPQELVAARDEARATVSAA